jgi:signal peptidase II
MFAQGARLCWSKSNNIQCLSQTEYIFKIMVRTRKQTLTIFWLVSIFVILLDQVTKFMILTAIPVNSSETIIPGLLNFTHVKNPGAAFGAFAENGGTVGRIALSIVSFVALVVIAWIVFCQPLDFYSVIGFALFFGGAAGNFIDRILFGEVTDFIDVYARGLHWPAFNVADSALSIGAFIFCMRLIIPSRAQS